MYSEWENREAYNEPFDLGRVGMFLAGAVAGAGLMYLLDPRGGARRRSLIRDKVVRGSRSARMYGGKVARHARNQVVGGIEERKARWRERGEQVPDDVLAERVRAQIGHVVSHPGSIEVTVADGVVSLRGPVVYGEVDKICDRLESTRGVRDYEIELTEHDQNANIPGLQGESRDQRERRAG